MYIGIDIGGTNIKGVLADIDGNILASSRMLTGKTADEIDNVICDSIDKLTKINSITKRNIKAIGIGAAGAINKEKGMILTSANIPSWKNYPLIKKIEGRTGIKAFLENDATIAAIGEWWKGKGRKFNNWIMLTLGTGIGGGAIINNLPYTGRSGSSMEFGHTTIDYKGKKCPCGNRGCLEMYASATAIVKIAKSKLIKNVDSSINNRIKNEILTSKIICEEAIAGDRLANEIINEMSVYLGIGISNFISIFNPEAIFFGGGLSNAFKLIEPVVKKIVNDRVQKGLKENIKYLIIKDEGTIPALGAAKIAIDNLTGLKK